MHNKLVSRLASAQWTVVVLGILVFLYLAVLFPETVVVRDSAATAEQIQETSGITELRQIAFGLNFLGHGATVVSGFMFGVMTFALFLFVALSVLNLHWLSKLKKLQQEHQPHANEQG